MTTLPPQNFITEGQRQVAIAYLQTCFDRDTLLSLHDFIYTEQWPQEWHFGFGTHVRNLLREQFNWDDLLLDAEWAQLAAQAAREYVEANPSEAAQ
ncbi:MAG: hypothetical protein FOGNACKC_00785 [Anaerolineae bacterium]|nr:hypothetical protein [Anaerolineae bacterium]